MSECEKHIEAFRYRSQAVNYYRVLLPFLENAPKRLEVVVQE